MIERRIKRALLGCLFGMLAASSGLAAQERFRKSPPVPEPLRELKLPAIESVRLTNGLTVAVAFSDGHRFIHLELIVQAGESYSPEGLPGLAAFTAEMLSRGTVALSAADIEERIEFVGGDLTTTTSLDEARFSLHFLDEYLDQALEVLSQMMLQPAFAEREVTNLKRIQFYDLLERQRDPDFVGRRQLLRLLFRDHPYGKGFYNEDVIKNISRKDVLAFHGKYYRPNNAVLVLTGNLNLSTATRRVSHYFNTWRSAEIDRPAIPAPQPNGEERVCLVDLPKTRDATLVVGNLIFPLVHPDFFPFSVLNQVLGATPNSRLFMNLRESKGYAYFAFSRMEFYRQGGVYSILSRVVPSACYAAVEEILDEVAKMTREKVSNFEIEQAKSRLIGNYPLQVENQADLARRASEMVTLSMSSAYWDRLYDSIMLIDTEKVHEVALRHLEPRPIVVIVGDKSRLFEFIEPFERVEIYDARGEYQYTVSKGVEK